MLYRRILLLLLLSPLLLRAAEYHWEKLEGCTLIDGKWKDGDSFHVKAGDRELIIRLYFVDTPEDENRFPDRVAEQAAYFGVTPARALRLGGEAAKFTMRELGAKPFTVYTLWQDALGSSKQKRYYGHVVTGKGPLCEQLVRHGLARIYGKRIQLPDGTDSPTYRARLAALEEEARAQKLGGWKPETP